MKESDIDLKESAHVTLTERAARRVREIIAEEDGGSTNLRVFVSGGGCSGFQYGFTLDNINDGDVVLSQYDITIVIDPMSLPYLEGAKIDYHSGLDGSQFIIKNPNASGSCGCGSSFSV